MRLLKLGELSTLPLLPGGVPTEEPLPLIGETGESFSLLLGRTAVERSRGLSAGAC